MKKFSYLLSFLLILSSCIFFSCNKSFSLDAKGSRIKIKNEILTVQWAKTEADRIQGLQGRTSLGENSGMIFDYGEERFLSFWMKDTPIPLSIAFINEEGVILEITDMKPESIESHRSKQKARYALEVNQGWFDRHRIYTGDRVQFIAG